MPDHQHGSPKQTDVVEVSPGEYELKPVNLFMPGYWEISVTASHNGQEDSSTFKFCIGSELSAAVVRARNPTSATKPLVWAEISVPVRACNPFCSRFTDP